VIAAPFGHLIILVELLPGILGKDPIVKLFLFCVN
jgi:hypothetical protein